MFVVIIRTDCLSEPMKLTTSFDVTNPEISWQKKNWYNFARCQKQASGQTIGWQFASSCVQNKLMFLTFLIACFWDTRVKKEAGPRDFMAILKNIVCSWKRSKDQNKFLLFVKIAKVVFCSFKTKKSLHLESKDKKSVHETLIIKHKLHY